MGGGDGPRDTERGPRPGLGAQVELWGDATCAGRTRGNTEMSDLGPALLGLRGFDPL